MRKIIFLFAISLLSFTNNLIAQLTGCTDSKAINYNALATINDGSCVYELDTITPILSINLDNVISETSGLIQWNDQVWTHNDSGCDPIIYALDTLTGNIIQSLPLAGTSNVDWEEICQDNDFIYVGDFGNNINGNRTDLKILRVSKNSILINDPIIDTIHFSYSNQTDFTATGANSTDFDCEAFIVSEDSIFLFTKQWLSEKTSVYELSKTPGTHIATLKSTFDVKGLITGSVSIDSKNLLALCGYSKTLQPFIYLLYDFNGSDFFSANKRKVIVSLPFHQVEGITTTNGLKYYISNEYFPQLNTLQKLHILDLTTFLDAYISASLADSQIKMKNSLSVYPNPATHSVTFRADNFNTIPHDIIITDLTGRALMVFVKDESEIAVDVSNLSNGIYIYTIMERNHTIKTGKLIIVR